MSIQGHSGKFRTFLMFDNIHPRQDCCAAVGFNDNIYQEGNISKMPDFDVFSLLEIRKRKCRSHGKRQKGNDKRKRNIRHFP